VKANSEREPHRFFKRLKAPVCACHLCHKRVGVTEPNIKRKLEIRRERHPKAEGREP